ncbi:putative bifunctional diguanylate cyclase/phosphodiesterase [Pigmentiphaga litoralis]|uniref:putative bifunctional diguanylate cyclase/phosphodiesterase n=1 Tax=Pigmentiphaga litoralis TaxID=516702 RepID=UPI003B43C9B8
MLPVNYHPALVVLSICVAILASYTALGMANRVRATAGIARRIWLTGGALAMGLGIWSMHFIGMLAFSLPISLGYDVGLTTLSVVIAIVSSAFALNVASQPQLSAGKLCGAAVLMGAGIAAMHYVGMGAMRMDPGISYDTSVVILSIAIAIVASGAALWIARRTDTSSLRERLLRLGAGVIMGLAIVGMHYTGMAAASFPVGTVCLAAGSGMSASWLALLVTTVTLGVLAIALVAALLDARMQQRTAALSFSLEAANEELIRLALHDTLTGLPNRILLQEHVKRSVEQGQRGRGTFAVMFVDLDGFKAINDAYGHHTGDALLVSIAQRLRHELRAEDSIARLGGDEFVVLASAADPQDAAQLAQRLIDVVSAPVALSEHLLLVTASIGIAMFPGDGDSGASLMTNADAAMYHAKSLGRAGYCFFEPSMNANAREQLRLLQDLRSAVANNEFELYYQPKFEAPAGPVVGAEALLRWHHPERGLVPPDRFIPLAEKTGLILTIDAWVINEACRQLRAWCDSGHTAWNMAVNLSALQFQHAGLVDLVRDALARHGVAAERLTLEITESIAMRDAEASMDVLNRLVALGVSISIDDFGTGYSSLMYLKRLPATELKIDQGFVSQLEHDGDDAAIISAIVALAHKLGLNIVAEGVETPEQQDFLTRLGCNSLQGFLLGHPLPAAQFVTANAHIHGAAA